MRSFLFAAFATACLCATSGSGAEIRIVPADFIALNATNADKGYSDLVVHTVAVATTAHEQATLASLKIELLSAGRPLLVRDIQLGEIRNDTAYLAGAPLPQIVAGQVLNPAGLDGLFGRHVRLASSSSLGSSEVLVATRLHFSVNFAPDTVRVTARLTGDGINKDVNASVPVRTYMSPFHYRSPLSGEWLMQAIPGVQSHHRFNPPTEFAIDFFKLGPDGLVVHGDPHDANDFYGFGEPVMAAGDGTVVNVIADQVQDRDALIRNTGETTDHFLARVDEFHMARMRTNFAAANAGNLVTLRHEKNGMVEYSTYGHLKSGSVHVRPGDHVTQGQVIGEVGDTGDSAEVHLHFQINEGSDPFTSKSLPVTFTNLRGVDGNSEMGLLVSTAGGETRF